MQIHTHGVFKNLYFRLVLLGISLLTPLAAQEGQLDLPTAIQLLQHADYDQREAASLFLWKNDDLAELEKVKSHDDPEVRHRVAKIILNLRSCLTPDTPSEITALVHRFHSASLEQKAQIHNTLKDKLAFVQMFALDSQMETNERTRPLKLEIARYSSFAVRHYLTEQDFSSALKVLEFAEPTTSNSRSWAFIVESQGQSATKLASLLASSDKTERINKQILALYRVQGQDEQARQWAQKIKHSPYLAGQALLSEDFDTYLKWWTESFATDTDEEYLAALQLRIKGNIKGAMAPARAIIRNAQNSEEKRVQSILLLASMGELTRAYNLLTEDEKAQQAQLLTQQGKYETYFKLLGLELGQPVSQDWIDANVNFEESSWWFDEDTRIEQLTKALAELGDFDSLERLTTPLWLQAKKDEQFQFEFLRQLASKGMKSVALAITQKLSGEELEILVKSLNASDELSSYYYSIISKAFPQKSIPHKIDLILSATTGIITGQSQLDDITALISAIEADCLANPEDKPREAKLANLYLELGYKKKYFSYLHSLYQKEPTPENASVVAQQHVFFDEWDKAAEMILTYENTGLGNETNLDLYKCAILKRGRKITEMQELLGQLTARFYDTPISYRNAASVFASLDLYQEAETFLSRGLALSDPDEQNFLFWEQFLQIKMELCTTNGQDRQAALCGEALILKNLKDTFSSDMLSDISTNQSIIQIMMGLRLKTNLCWLRHYGKSGETKAAQALSQKISKEWSGNPTLSDDFYPLLHTLGANVIITKSATPAFDRHSRVIDLYPSSHTAMNAAAWIASRARVRVPQAEAYIDQALSAEPRNSAYLDTRAELHFIKGDRPRALSFSLRAWQDSRDAQVLDTRTLIKQQYYHFLNDPLPPQ